MSSRIWYLLSGLALLIGSLLSLVFITMLNEIVNANYSNNHSNMYTPLQSPGLHSLWWVVLNLMGILGSVLILIGLPAVYTYQAKQAGWLGWVGLTLTFCAIVLTGVFGVVLNSFGIWFLDNDASQLVAGEGPLWSDWLFIVDSAIFSVGAILLGVASVRAGGASRSEDARVPLGLAFILAGFLSVVHLVPSSALGSFWSLDEGASVVAVAMFLLSLAAFGLILVSRSEASPIVKRPLLYRTLTASVVTGYILVVGSIGVLVQQTRVAFILSLFLIGLIAILFQPVRDRLQRAVNRLVYGERDNPYAVLSQLGKHMEATLAPESVLPTIVETIARSLKLPYAAILLKQEDEFTVAAAYGSPMEPQQRFPIVYQAEQLGELVLSPRSAGESLTPADQRLLHDIAPQIGVAVHAARVTIDLQRSRERLVTAREEERRRLRRDLHDGLGPQLASLTLKLETARNRLAGDPQADALLSDLAERTQATVAEIRRLVYALRPPALDELGLVCALRELTLQSSDQVVTRLEAPDGLPELPAAVEVALYRIAQEALTNVVRHAHARHCDLRLTLAETTGWLSLSIQDDGCGLPCSRGVGVGLVSMRERAEELGGTWIIEPVPTGGACVHARLPYARSRTADVLVVTPTSIPQEKEQ